MSGEPDIGPASACARNAEEACKEAALGLVMNLSVRAVQIYSMAARAALDKLDVELEKLARERAEKEEKWVEAERRAEEEAELEAWGLIELDDEDEEEEE